VESLEPAVVVSHISRKTSEMWGTRDLLRGCENKKKRPQISPLRYAPVEMTILFKGRIPRFQEKYDILAATELSSRPERSGVERSAVSFSSYPFFDFTNVSRASLSKTA
jgi:hypothetical protein